MRFAAEHRFSAPITAVAEVLVDPDFYRSVELPDVALLEVVDLGDDGGGSALSLRYEYVGQLDAVVKRLLRGRRLTWLQDVTVADTREHGRITFAVEGGRRVGGTADFTLSGDGAGGDTVWALRGEVRVGVPLVGRDAERRLVAGFLDRLAIEADEMTAWLAAR